MLATFLIRLRTHAGGFAVKLCGFVSENTSKLTGATQTQDLTLRTITQWQPAEPTYGHAPIVIAFRQAISNPVSKHANLPYGVYSATRLLAQKESDTVCRLTLQSPKRNLLRSIKQSLGRLIQGPATSLNPPAVATAHHHPNNTRTRPANEKEREQKKQNPSQVSSSLPRGLAFWTSAICISQSTTSSYSPTAIWRQSDPATPCMVSCEICPLPTWLLAYPAHSC